MINFKRRAHPLEFVLGASDIILFFLVDYSSLLYTFQIIVLTLKYRYEGFRVTIFSFAFGKLLTFITGYQIISTLLSVYYIYQALHLEVFQLPSEGPPVGYQWSRSLEEYGLDEMSIYYPAEITKEKIGFRWLKADDYANRMNDTVKKDINGITTRNKYTPKFFFTVVSSQFYKFKMNIYDNAPMKDQPTYPIIIFSPGLASHCDGYSVYARFLSQLGYIVFCPEHIENIRNIYPSDEDNRIYRIEQLKKRFETVQKILDIIYDPKQFNSIIKSPQGQLITPDYDEISIIGHSFGGSTALYTSFHDSRITGACIAYDPAMYVFEDGLCTLNGSDLHVPCLSINADDFYARLYAFMENDQRIVKLFNSLHNGIFEHCVSLYINNQQHADFSDLPLVWCGEAKLYGLSRKLDEIHLRTSIILSITKTFLNESKKYKLSQKSQAQNGVYKRQDLKKLLTDKVEEEFTEAAAKLIRWQQKKEV